MKRLNERKMNIGRYLLQTGRRLTRSGRLAGMIQVCRPDWSAETAWYAAQLLNEEGVTRQHAAASLTDYLAYLDSRLTRFAQHHFAEQEITVANELELQRWASRWQHYRDMASVDHCASSARAA